MNTFTVSGIVTVLRAEVQDFTVEVVADTFSAAEALATTKVMAGDFDPAEDLDGCTVASLEIEDMYKSPAVAPAPVMAPATPMTPEYIPAYSPVPAVSCDPQGFAVAQVEPRSNGYVPVYTYTIPNPAGRD